MKTNADDYVIRVHDSPLDVPAADWNALLFSQEGGHGHASPFMRHEYLAALHDSGSATPDTGWTPCFITLWQGSTLAGACPLYLKTHSYGEYVFDTAWANAYHQHGLAYYPKALAAVPFTPVPGPRLLARTAPERVLLVKALVSWCVEQQLSSLHLLFLADQDLAACREAGLMLRHTVQFHWANRKSSAATALRCDDQASPSANGAASPPANQPAGAYRDFEDFLSSLSREKRKKIRQERRKVAEAGISFRHAEGRAISHADWDLFYQCYERTYYEHGNAPYLSRDFFRRMQASMPDNWVLFVAEHTDSDGNKQSVATSLIAHSMDKQWACGQFDAQKPVSDCPDASPAPWVAYGRYWGALARVDCLHFEACYYQPLQWCIARGVSRFEGGAQGEHKMARALLPVKATSAHWLAHPSFADAVERFLAREGAGIASYMDELERRNPFKPPTDS